MTAYVVHRLNAGNDANGNPRRVLVGIGLDGSVRVADEGYNGDGPSFIAQQFGADAVYSGVTHATTAGEYRRLLKMREG